MDQPAQILCIESKNQESLCPGLEKRGYRVVLLPHDCLTLEGIREHNAEVVVVNALAATYRGEEVCRTLRMLGVDLPILLLLPAGVKTPPDSQADVVLVKPFTTRKVVNRIKKLAAEPPAHILQVGDIQLNCRTRWVQRNNGLPKKLTPKQTKLLETLMRHPGQVLSRRYLMKQVWQTDYLGDTRTLDVHIRWLREKIEPEPNRPIYITTKRGQGYRLNVPAATSGDKEK